MVLREQTIDTDKMTENDKSIKNVFGDVLTIQVDGSAELTITGKNTELDDYYDIGLVNMTTLSKESSISSPGYYMAIITGLDDIKLDITGSGKIHWKEIGD